jgi:hypothetical protein
VTAFTTLRVIEAGVVLWDGHLARLRPAGPWVEDAFDRFARDASPGVYALTAAAGRLTIEPRPGSRLHDGIPVRFRESPLAGCAWPFPKPAPPGPYAAVRAPGVATLLTDATGAEILEACVAAVIAWDGASLVVPPADRPRVASVAEAAIRTALPVREAPIAARGGWGLALVNAVAGICRPATGPDREPFPEEVAARIEALLLSTARR